MKICDLVKMDEDDVFGMIMELNTAAAPSLGACWLVCWFAYRRSLPEWEHELVVINESR